MIMFFFLKYISQTSKDLSKAMLFMETSPLLLGIRELSR